MAAAKRIYLVRGGDGSRLVRASSAAQARNHVARDLFRVGVASQDELVALCAAGTAVENADAAPEDPREQEASNNG